MRKFPSERVRRTVELVVAVFLWYMLWSYFDSISLYQRLDTYLTEYGIIITYRNESTFVSYLGVLILVVFIIVIYDISKWFGKGESS